MTNWSSRKLEEGIFCTVYFVRKKFFLISVFFAMYSALNTLPEYTYFCISKSITSDTFLLVFKIVESLQCILNTWNIHTGSVIRYGYIFIRFGKTNLSCHSVVVSVLFLDFIYFNSPSFTSIQEDITDTGIACMSTEIFQGRSHFICHCFRTTSWLTKGVF